MKTQVADAQNQLEQMGEMLESFVQNIEENMNDLVKRAGANIGEVTLENRDLEQYALGLVSRVATEQENVGPRPAAQALLFGHDPWTAGEVCQTGLLPQQCSRYSHSGTTTVVDWRRSGV